MATRDTNFTATGPASVGFEAFGDFKTGVLGVGFLALDGPVDLTVVGVSGTTGAEPDHEEGGIGVLGRTSAGIGVRGTSSALSQDSQQEPCIGVSGKAVAGTGVEGESDQGRGVLGKGPVGVQGEGGIGVFGSGSEFGVQGVSDTIGVLGGPAAGGLFAQPREPIGVGVAGVAIGDVRAGDIPYAYGGWFDADNGTAPLHLEPSANDTPPPAAHRGDLFVDNAGQLWFCITSGRATTASDVAVWKRVQLV